MRVLILHSQVPFARGGAEILVEGLHEAIAARGHEVDVVGLPLTWNPVEGLLDAALAWRLLDVRSVEGRPVDRVICTKYPTWAVRHPRKSLWLIHQHRSAYDLLGTPLSDFTSDPADMEVRRRVVHVDRIGISECDRRFAISRNVSGRLRRYTGLDAETLYPPVPRQRLSPDAFDPFILSVGRLNRTKRTDLIVRAWSHVRTDLRLVIVGEGPERESLERLARRTGQQERISFRGRVSDQELARLYNRCRGVFYAPIDEDFGFATVEALAAGKPVITAPDSGGVLEFIEDGANGFVVDTDPVEIASAVDRLDDPSLARSLGRSGPELTSSLNWDSVVDGLLGRGA